MFRSIRHVLLLPLLGLAAWYLITKLQIFSPYLLPPPAAVWDAFRDSVADGTLWTHLAISLQRVFLGFFLSAVTAIPLGILCGRSRLFYTYGWFLLEFFRHVRPWPPFRSSSCGPASANFRNWSSSSGRAFSRSS